MPVGYAGQLCGVTTTCLGCNRGVHGQCFIVMEGEAGRAADGEEGSSVENRWCFACACRGCAKPAGDANTQECMRCKCHVHATCIKYGVCLLCASPAHETTLPRAEARAFHTSWWSGRPWLKFQHGVMHFEACRAFPQLGAQLEWIARNKKCKWAKIDNHQTSEIHAVPLALWDLAVR